jgi:glucose/arabinose dehydrogenase
MQWQSIRRLTAATALALGLAACEKVPFASVETPAGPGDSANVPGKPVMMVPPVRTTSDALKPSAEFPAILIPEGYRIEKLAEGLTYPTSITWDDQGRMYVAEAGGAFLEEPPPARILELLPGGKTREVANLDGKIHASIVGLTWHDGAFYFTHRAKDGTGAVSRMSPDGKVEMLFSGIQDAKTDHQPNDIRVGPDGRMYVASGVGGNVGVMGQDMTPFVLKWPDARATPCKDIVLTGQNFEFPDFRTKQQGDKVLTGAFVPYGTPTTPGQTIKGTNKCGGSILVFDPQNAEATLRPYAWGFRNVVGLAWNGKGEMFAAQNGYDQIPPRPIRDFFDPVYRVREGAWYGWPDFSAAGDPLTNDAFVAPGSLYAASFIDGKRQPKEPQFLIDHKASGLSPPDKELVVGLHPINSSPSKLDVAPDTWGDVAGRLFVAEWGDLTWFNNATRTEPVGNQITWIDPGSKEIQPFIQNVKPGPGSEQDATGKALERPFDLRFGPDGAMYIVDYGQMNIVLARVADGHLPFEFVPRSGMIWRVTRQQETAAR